MTQKLYSNEEFLVEVVLINCEHKPGLIIWNSRTFVFNNTNQKFIEREFAAATTIDDPDSAFAIRAMTVAQDEIHSLSFLLSQQMTAQIQAIDTIITEMNRDLILTESMKDPELLVKSALSLPKETDLVNLRDSELRSINDALKYGIMHSPDESQTAELVLLQIKFNTLILKRQTL